MIRILFLLITSIFANSLFGQPKVISGKVGRKLTKKEIDMDKINRNCIHSSKYSLEQIRSFFPFNRTRQIKLVSFDQVDSNVIVSGIPKNGDKVDYQNLKEVIDLNKKGADSLLDLLYNTGYKGPFFTISEMNCYIPRNAILFVNGEGNTFAYIELCFECQKFKTSSKQVKTGDFCEQKFLLLRYLFAKAGIKYGVEKENKYTSGKICLLPHLLTE